MVAPFSEAEGEFLKSIPRFLERPRNFMQMRPNKLIT
jgi:hypothetical protein